MDKEEIENKKKETQMLEEGFRKIAELRKQALRVFHMARTLKLVGKGEHDLEAKIGEQQAFEISEFADREEIWWKSVEQKLKDQNEIEKDNEQ